MSDDMSMMSNRNIEIERKFLVISDLPRLTNGKRIIQSYIFASPEKELRIRITDNKCLLSIKINMDDFLREEYEYKIPLEEGKRLIKIGTNFPPIEKVRYIINVDNMNWEIDLFEGENEGLVLAEIELTHPDQEFEKPSWIKEEVTSDLRFYNANLFTNPYKKWCIK